jgi:acyl carrier protein
MVLEVVDIFLVERSIDREVSLQSHLSLVDIGLDSVACLELMAEVERRAAMTIPERHWEAVSKMNLAALVDLVVKNGRF